MTFEEYVRSIEPQVLRVGIARIVAPPEWTPRARGYSDVDCLVPRPVRQLASGARGLYRTCLLEERPRHVAGRGGFAEGATAADAQAPGGPGADVDVRGCVLCPPALLFSPSRACVTALTSNQTGLGAGVLETGHLQPAAVRRRRGGQPV
jgi:hypothetical protein